LSSNYTENNTLTAQIQHLGAGSFLKKSNQGKKTFGNPEFWGKTFSSFISIVGTKKQYFFSS
jgi:hypothetical protein